jgi:hypothetical protein
LPPGPRWLWQARPHIQGSGVSPVDEIGVEREGSLELGDTGVVLALPNQDISKLSASLWQAGIEVNRRLRQFKSAIKRSGTEIIAIERFGISEDVSPGQHRSGARVMRVDRQGLFDQTPCVIEGGLGREQDRVMRDGPTLQIRS